MFVAQVLSLLRHSQMGKQTKPCVMVVELLEEEVDGNTLSRAVVHLYRAEMITGIVEVDTNGTMLKLGTHMHQPGELASLHTEVQEPAG